MTLFDVVRNLFHWLMVAAIVVMALLFMGLFGEIFREHIRWFLMLWFFLPILAFWLGTKAVRQNISLSRLLLARVVLTCTVAVISFAFLVHLNEVRDAVGKRFVEGYQVTYSEDTDDFGHPIKTPAIATDHWYSRFGLYAFNLGFILLCLGLPVVTWVACSRAIKASEHDNTG
jgi:hypothetical protein